MAVQFGYEINENHIFYQKEILLTSMKWLSIKIPP